MGQIDKAWPGTKLGITEYSYGGGRVVSGLLAQADVLGIFGREGLFAACVFGMGKDDAAQIAGFKAFRDFAGKGARFGDVGLAVRGADAASESVYAARDSKLPSRLTLVVINKTNRPRSYRIPVAASPRAIHIEGRAFVRSEGHLALPVAETVEVQGGTLAASVGPVGVETVEATVSTR